MVIVTRAALICVAATVLLGCGDEDSTPSNVPESGGSGATSGAPGSGGSWATGGAGGTGGAAGALGSGGAPDTDWKCAAAPGGNEIFIALDGDDSNPGTIEAPLATFGSAVTRAMPGDVIYVRAGTYGKAQAMVSGVNRHDDSYPATSCPEGQALADQYCFTDKHAFIALKDFSGWASKSAPFKVQSGTAEEPIAICAYPGEHVTLDATGWTSRAVDVSLKAHWTIADFEIVGAMVNIGGGTADAQPHDIVIRRNDVHDITIDGGDNPGIVRIDRGDINGPWNIFVWDNELHGIYDVDQPGDWHGVPDAQHFGAVTTLSRENYYGFDGGGTGYIEIIGNEMYDLPQTFFFKNPMVGPIEIRDNFIHDAGSLGIMTAANVHVRHNLVVGVSTGFWAVGNGGYSDDRLTGISGQHAIIEYNTFVGLSSLLGLRCGTGHVVEHNVFFGLTGSTNGANWDTASFISKSGTYADPLDPAQSILQQMTSNHNCFISAHADFQHVARYLPPAVTGADWKLDHWDLAKAQNLFGFDTDSEVVVQSDPNDVFVDPSAGNYALSDSSTCAGMGYYANPNGD
jgi:hypothetical protein